MTQPPGMPNPNAGNAGRQPAEPPDPRQQADAALTALADTGRPIQAATLRGLSGLTERQFSAFADRWQALPAERRRRVVVEMVELAEDNVELDFGPVLKLSLRDPDAEVRRSAIEGLWEADDRRLADEFVRLAQTDRVETVRIAAAEALGRFAYLHELGDLDPTTGERVRETLTALFENEDEPGELRRRALESLAFISADEVHDLIVDAYRDDDPKMHATALFAMGRSCDPGWLDVLLRELKSPVAEFRFEAARACGEMEDPAPVPELVTLLQDDDGEVRLAAIAALGKIGGNQAKRALMRAATGSDDALAVAAQDALDELNFGEDPFAFRLGGRPISEN